MRHIGFNNKLCDLIFKCINTPSSIIINGIAYSWFNPTSSIGQGDLLSSFLYLFGMLLLDHEIKNKISNGRFEVKNKFDDKEFSILSYADDLLIISNAKQLCWKILDSLDRF